MQKKIRMKFRNETKGTYRYEEIVAEDEKPVIQTIYLKKYAVEGDYPKELEVTILAE